MSRKFYANVVVLLCLVLSLMLVACGDSATSTPAAAATTSAATKAATTSSANTAAAATTSSATTAAAATTSSATTAATTSATTKAASTTSSSATTAASSDTAGALSDNVDLESTLVDAFKTGFMGKLSGLKAEDVTINLTAFGAEASKVAVATDAQLVSGGYKPVVPTDMTKPSADGTFLGFYTMDGQPDLFIIIGAVDSPTFSALTAVSSATKGKKTIGVAASGVGLIKALQTGS